MSGDASPRRFIDSFFSSWIALSASKPYSTPVRSAASSGSSGTAPPFSQSRIRAHISARLFLTFTPSPPPALRPSGEAPKFTPTARTPS